MRQRGDPILLGVHSYNNVSRVSLLLCQRGDRLSTIMMQSLKRGRKITRRNKNPFYYEQRARKRLREENFGLKSRLESLEDKHEPMKKENEALKVRVKPSLVDEMFTTVAGFSVGHLRWTEYCRKL